MPDGRIDPGIDRQAVISQLQIGIGSGKNSLSFKNRKILKKASRSGFIKV